MGNAGLERRRSHRTGAALRRECVRVSPLTRPRDHACGLPVASQDVGRRKANYISLRSLPKPTATQSMVRATLVYCRQAAGPKSSARLSRGGNPAVGRAVLFSRGEAAFQAHLGCWPTQSVEVSVPCRPTAGDGSVHLNATRVPSRACPVVPFSQQRIGPLLPHICLPTCRISHSSQRKFSAFRGSWDESECTWKTRDRPPLLTSVTFINSSAGNLLRPRLPGIRRRASLGGPFCPPTVLYPFSSQMILASETLCS